VVSFPLVAAYYRFLHLARTGPGISRKGTMKILNAVRHDIQILIRRLSVFILFSVNMQQLINCAILNQIPGVWFLVLAYIIFVYCTCN
jgi:hypothetical protein